jgi:hypothetical protein
MQGIARDRHLARGTLKGKNLAKEDEEEESKLLVRIFMCLCQLLNEYGATICKNIL